MTYLDHLDTCTKCMPGLVHCPVGYRLLRDAADEYAKRLAPMPKERDKC